MADVRWRKTIGPAQVLKLSVGPMDNNVYLLSVDDESLLIDGSNEADAILAELGERRLVTIVQTHGHGDHVVALPDLVERTSAPVLVHDADKATIPVATGAVGNSVSLGPVELEVRHTPGHTPGSISLILRHEGETHVFSGDTLFPGGPGGTFGDDKAFANIMKSLDTQLFTLPDDAHVYPGHGADTTIGTERPSVEEWRARGW